MATRNRLFPVSKKSVPFSAARTKPAATPTVQPIAKPKVTSYNAKDVVLNPDFELCRPITGADDIELTITAHQMEEGQWAAEFIYTLRQGPIPSLGRPLNRNAARFPTRSEAVDDAMMRGLRTAKERPHPASGTKAWAASVESLRVWMDDAMVQVRAKDEGLKFKHLTGMDFFSGVGGASIGMVSHGMKIKLACEIEATERAVYQAAVRPEFMHDDICTLLATCKAKGIKLECDVAFMGLLCQAFASSGKRLGFDDPDLRAAYLSAMEVLEALDAKVIFVECAPDFLKVDGGKHADEFIKRVMMCNYQVQHQVLNASRFGVPQERLRSVLVFTRMDVVADPIMGYLFPEGKEPTAAVEDILEPNVAATTPDADIEWSVVEQTGRAARRVKLGHINGKKYQGNRVYSTQGLGITLTASGGGKCRFSGAYRVKDGARALTPREACRMQGFPEYVQHHPVHAHAMRHAGNAVSVPMARELIRQLGPIFAKRG